MPADDADIEILRTCAADRTIRCRVVVTGCAHSCCGRGWVRRDGFEQTYAGWIDNYSEPAEDERERGMVGTFMVYSAGLGKLSYVVAVRFTEVELVELLNENA